MLSYPSIPSWRKSRGLNKHCIAFNKYDGSNLRWEWSPKRGWYKFGSRTELFDTSHPVFSSAPDLFLEVIADKVVAAVKRHYPHKRKIERIVAFTEFFGEKTFAGVHQPDDPTKKMVLFDVSVYKEGFLTPETFRELFHDEPWAAKVVYEGLMDEPFVFNVRHNGLPQLHLTEGVVCKGDGWSAKIKTFEFINKLKHRFGQDWEKYAE